MKDPELNKEEQEDLTAIEDAVFESKKNGKPLIDEERLEKLQKAAVNTLNKDERINHQYINRNIK